MYYIFIGIFSVVCLVVMPFFLLEQRNPSNRSLLLKMICATMFLMVGVFSYRVAGPSEYANFMLLGLGCSWFGDLFLHIQGKAKTYVFPLGVLFFLAAHIMYLLAYDSYLSRLQPEQPVLAVWELCVIAAGMVLYLFVFILTRTKFSAFMVPLAFYVFVLMLMCVRALTLAHLQTAFHPAFSVLLGIGAIFFLLSDTSLGLLMFNNKCKANFPLKIFNIATYFIGQLLLAGTILLR